jgi:hypothetical protein
MINGSNTTLLLPVAGGMIDGRDTALGMMHAWVGEKLLKNTFLRVFRCPEVELETQFQTSTNAMRQPLLHIVFYQLDPPNKL